MNRRRIVLLIACVLVLIVVLLLLCHRQEAGKPAAAISEQSHPPPLSRRPGAISAGPWQPPVIDYNREPVYQALPDFERTFNDTEGSYVVHARVYSDERQPIPGAAVSLFRSYDMRTAVFSDRVATASTGEEGTCTLELDAPLTLGYLAASKPGHTRSFSAIMLDEPGWLRRDFILSEATASVRGRVADSRGYPIQGARVSSSATEFGGAVTHISPVAGVTDNLGEYQIEGLSPGDVRLGASAEGYLSLMLMVRALGSREARSNVDFSLQERRFAAVRVRVHDSSGRAIQGARIGTSAGAATVSGSDGIAVLLLRPEDSEEAFQSTVSADGFKTRLTTIDPQRSQIAVMLEHANELSGLVVTPNGQPVRGARVTITAIGATAAARTDASGSFTVPIAVSPGTATISRAGYVDSRIEYDAYHGPQFVRVVLEPAGGLYGRVVDESGRPVRIFVFMGSETGTKASTFRWPAFESFDGDFAVCNLPGGRWTLEFRCMEGGSRNSLSARIDDVEIRPGSMYGPVTVVLKGPAK